MITEDRVSPRRLACSGCGHGPDGRKNASPTLLLEGLRLGLHRRWSQLASVRKEHTPVPCPGACVKASAWAKAGSIDARLVAEAVGALLHCS
jgi:hypothetical protein